MSFLLPLIYFSAITGSFTFLFKKNFGSCLPIAFMMTMFTLFFSQFIFHTFEVGFYVNILFAILCPILYFYRRKKDKSCHKLFFTKGFFAFLIFYVGIYFLDYHRTFSMWDEFSHWGVMVKEMLRLDKFYSVADSSLMVHKDYPPIIQLFELFWCKLCGGYSETYLIKALHVFNFGLLIPIFEKKEKVKSKIQFILQTMLTFIAFYCLILFFDAHGIINAIYTDYSISLLVALGLFLTFKVENIKSNFFLISLSLIGSTLVLTKQIGLPLYLMILFCYALIFYFKEIYKKTWKHLKFYVKAILLLLCIPFGLWLLWNHYIDTLGIVGQFELSDLHPSLLLQIARGNAGEAWQNRALHNFMYALVDYNIICGNFSLSYVELVFIGCSLLYGVFSFHKEKIKKNYFYSLFISVIIGSVGYAFVMLVMYVFSFGPAEGPGLASFNRYMPTYVLIIFLLALMIYLYFKENKQKNYLIVIVIALFLALDTSSFHNIYPKILLDEANGYSWHAGNLVQKTEENSKIFVIAQNSSGNYQFYIKYYAGSRTTNLKHFSWPVTEEQKEAYGFTFEEIKEYMKDYDYLYLAYITEDFIKEYQDFFPDKENIQAENLYKITIQNEEICLSKVD